MQGSGRQPSLKGKSVLLAEDDHFIASDIAQVLTEIGATVLGPFAEKDKALAMVGLKKIDFGILDVRLGEEDSFSIAKALSEQKVPFVFITGGDSQVIPRQFKTIKVIAKPFTREGLIARLLGKRSLPHAFTENSLLANLPPEALALMKPHMGISELKRGRILGNFKSRSRSFFPVSGIIAVSLSHSGQTAEMGLVGSEGFASSSMFVEGPNNFDLLVLVPGFAITIDSAVLRAVYKDSVAAREELSRYERVFFMQIAATAASASIDNAESRLAGWLLMCADRVGNKIPVSQDSISLMLNVRRATVWECIQKFKSIGAVETARGHIELKDRAKLEAAASWAKRFAEAAYKSFLPSENQRRR